MRQKGRKRRAESWEHAKVGMRKWGLGGDRAVRRQWTWTWKRRGRFLVGLEKGGVVFRGVRKRAIRISRRYIFKGKKEVGFRTGGKGELGSGKGGKWSLNSKSVKCRECVETRMDT